jgi:hypothetical protein
MTEENNLQLFNRYPEVIDSHAVHQYTECLLTDKPYGVKTNTPILHCCYTCGSLRMQLETEKICSIGWKHAYQTVLAAHDDLTQRLNLWPHRLAAKIVNINNWFKSKFKCKR